MSFSPIVDVDLNFKNPITNTRTFGSDPDRVLRMAKLKFKALEGKRNYSCNRTLPRRWR